MRKTFSLLLPALLVFVLGFAVRQGRPVYSQSNLPDLVPNSFSACWRPKANNPTRAEVVLTSWEKNVGLGVAAAHKSRMSAQSGLACEGYTPAVAKILDVPVLVPTQVMPLYRNLALGNFPLNCGWKGLLMGSVTVDAYNTVVEEPGPSGNGDGPNNVAYTYPVPACR